MSYYTYLLTPWSRVLLEKLTGFAANQEIPRILRKTRQLITVLTSARCLACEYFLTFCFSRGGVVSASPNPKAAGPPLVGCPRLFIQFIRSYPPHRRPFLHPQPEDAPCRGDRDPQTRGILLYTVIKAANVYTENECVLISNFMFQRTPRLPDLNGE